MKDVQLSAPGNNLEYCPELQHKNGFGKKDTKWSHIASSYEFQSLLVRKKKFLFRGILFSMVFYFLLPFSTSFYTFLSKPAVGTLSWAFVYGLSQFVMVWTMSVLYMRKANQFDQQSKEILKIYNKIEE